MCTGLHEKCPLFLSDVFKLRVEFSRQIFEKAQISRKSVWWKPSWSMRTDMTKLTVACCNFASASKDVNNCIHGMYVCMYVCVVFI